MSKSEIKRHIAQGKPGAKANELWEKYGPPKDANSPLYAQGKIKFLAALAEYGGWVRAQDVKVCRCYVVDDGDNDDAKRAAAAIEATPLP